MIKVMIVEDEPPIAKSIIKLVESYSSEINVVYNAINGKRAMDFLEEESVDLVFSDIKMPIMNGIELAKNINEQYPQIIMIIISGFQEFDYARSAMSYGVSNYLLKPITKKSIYEVLDKAVLDIKKRKLETSKKVLNDAINDNVSNVYSSHIKNCGIILICVGAFPVSLDETQLRAGEVFKSINIESKIEELLFKGESYIYINGKSVSEKTIVFSAQNKERVNILAKQIYDFIRQNSKFTVSVIVTEDLYSINQVNNVFLSLRKKLSKEILFANSQMLTENSFAQNNYSFDGNNYKSKIILAFKSQNFIIIKESIQDLLSEVVNNNLKQEDVVTYFDKYIIPYFDEGLGLEGLNSLKNNIHKLISDFNDPQEFSQQIVELLIENLQNNKLTTRTYKGLNYEDVAEYIRINYKKNISIDELSKKFDTPPFRIAKTFKEFFGMSVSEYINNFRIDASKELMKSDKNIMIKELAIEVGYNDQYYFSKSFKKITGIWPTEYQKQLQKD